VSICSDIGPSNIFKCFLISFGAVWILNLDKNGKCILLLFDLRGRNRCLCIQNPCVQDPQTPFRRTLPLVLTCTVSPDSARSTCPNYTNTPVPYLPPTYEGKYINDESCPTWGLGPKRTRSDAKKSLDQQWSEPKWVIASSTAVAPLGSKGYDGKNSSSCTLPNARSWDVYQGPI